MSDRLYPQRRPNGAGKMPIHTFGMEDKEWKQFTNLARRRGFSASAMILVLLRRWMENPD